MDSFRLSALLLLLVVVASAVPLSSSAKSDNCKGSSLCGSRVNQGDCRKAIARYTDRIVYSGYTSRVSGSCTAIFRCDGKYPSLRGSTLKRLFLHVYDHQPCRLCGSHAFDNGNCEATLNYCSRCRDSGNPNQLHG